jgi:hypothetical protein
MNMNTLAVSLGQAKPDAPAITVDGNDLSIKLGEDVVRAHLNGLRCDYCREQTVSRGLAGLELYVGERPDVSAIPRTEIEKLHDQNHETWHKWNAEAQKAKQDQRAQENKVYAGLKKLGHRGVALRDEAKKFMASMPKIVIPALKPETAFVSTHPKVERPAVVRKEPKGIKAKGFKHGGNDIRIKARTESTDRTLRLLALQAAGKL